MKTPKEKDGSSGADSSTGTCKSKEVSSMLQLYINKKLSTIEKDLKKDPNCRGSQKKTKRPLCERHVLQGSRNKMPGIKGLNPVLSNRLKRTWGREINPRRYPPRTALKKAPKLHEHSRLTMKETVWSVKLIILSGNPMTTEQMNLVHESILWAVGETLEEEARPRFTGCSHKTGWLLLQCAYKKTENGSRGS